MSPPSPSLTYLFPVGSNSIGRSFGALRSNSTTVVGIGRRKVAAAAGMRIGSKVATEVVGTYIAAAGSTGTAVVGQQRVADTEPEAVGQRVADIAPVVAGIGPEVADTEPEGAV